MKSAASCVTQCELQDTLIIGTSNAHCGPRSSGGRARLRVVIHGTPASRPRAGGRLGTLGRRPPRAARRPRPQMLGPSTPVRGALDPVPRPRGPVGRLAPVALGAARSRSPRRSPPGRCGSPTSSSPGGGGGGRPPANSGLALPSPPARRGRRAGRPPRVASAADRSDRRSSRRRHDGPTMAVPPGIDGARAGVSTGANHQHDLSSDATTRRT